MPFRSAKQRRYLWANEPEIARRWTKEHGSRIQKDNGGIMRLPFAEGLHAQIGTDLSSGAYRGHPLYGTERPAFFDRQFQPQGDFASAAQRAAIDEINPVYRRYMKQEGSQIPYGTGEFDWMETDYKGKKTPEIFPRTEAGSDLSKQMYYETLGFGEDNPEFRKQLKDKQDLKKIISVANDQNISIEEAKKIVLGSDSTGGIETIDVGEKPVFDAYSNIDESDWNASDLVEIQKQTGMRFRDADDLKEWIDANPNAFLKIRQNIRKGIDKTKDALGNIRRDNRYFNRGDQRTGPEKWMGGLGNIGQRWMRGLRNVGGNIGQGIGNFMGDRFQYKPAVASAGGYSAAQLNQLNARGGYYSPPVREQRRNLKRVKDMVAKRAAGEVIGRGNLGQLTGRDEGRGSYTATTMAAPARHAPAASTGYMGPGGVHYAKGGLASIWPR